MYIFTLCLQDAKTVHRFSQHIIQVDFQCWRNNTSKLYDFEDTIYLRIYIYTYIWASQVVLVVKNPPANARDIRDTGSIPASGRSTGGGHGNPLEYFCLENPMDRGACWATVHRVVKSQTRLKRLSKQAYIRVYVSMYLVSFTRMGSPGGSDSEESTCNTGDLGSIPGSRRSPGEEHDNPLQYSFLENSVHSGTWQATVQGVSKSQTLLSD